MIGGKFVNGLFEIDTAFGRIDDQNDLNNGHSTLQSDSYEADKDEFGFDIRPGVYNFNADDIESNIEHLSNNDSIYFESAMAQTFKSHASFPVEGQFSIYKMSKVIKEIQSDDRYAAISDLHAAAVSDLNSDEEDLVRRLVTPAQIIDFISDTSKSLTERAIAFNAANFHDVYVARDFLTENENLVNRTFYDIMLTSDPFGSNMGPEYKVSPSGVTEETGFGVFGTPPGISHHMYAQHTCFQFSHDEGRLKNHVFEDDYDFRSKFDGLPPEVQASYIGKNPSVTDLIAQGVENDTGKNFARKLLLTNPSLMDNLPTGTMNENLLLKVVLSKSDNDFSFLKDIDAGMLSEEVAAAVVSRDISASGLIPEELMTKGVLIKSFQSHGKMPDGDNVNYMNIVAAMSEVSLDTDKYAISDQQKISINDWQTSSKDYGYEITKSSTVVSLLEDPSISSIEKAKIFKGVGLDDFDSSSTSIELDGQSKDKIIQMASDYALIDKHLNENNKKDSLDLETYFSQDFSR